MPSMRAMPNPYIYLPLDDLCAEANRIAGDIQRREAKSAEERIALADRCFYMLLAMSNKIAPRHHGLNTPEAKDGPLIDTEADPSSRYASLVDRFADWTAGRVSVNAAAARSLTLRRAAEFAGIDAHRTDQLMDEFHRGGAFDSHEKMVTALRKLEAEATKPLRRRYRIG
jgi:hypothetical protein